MFTCHEHITDLFEEAGGAVRLLPSRDGSYRARRPKLPIQELPPPTPSLVPEQPEPARVAPVDPNPLLQMAAEELLYDPVHPLPEKPRRKRQPRPAEDWNDLHALSQAWRNRFQTLRESPKQEVPKLQLPDSWPVAELPLPKPPPAPAEPMVQPVKAKQVVAISPSETFEVLAYRTPIEIDEPMIIASGQQQFDTVILSAAEPTPPPPKHLTSRPAHRRFAWDSPEMYLDE
jgi:hypothetical protein